MRLYSISSASVSLPLIWADAPFTEMDTPSSAANDSKRPAIRRATDVTSMGLSSRANALSSSFESVSTSFDKAAHRLRLVVGEPRELLPVLRQHHIVLHKLGIARYHLQRRLHFMLTLLEKSRRMLSASASSLFCF